MALITVPPQTHTFITNAETFKNQFTGAEYDAITSSAQVDIVRIVNRLTTRNGVVNLRAAETVTIMALLVSETLITQERSDIIMVGIPLR